MHRLARLALGFNVVLLAPPTVEQIISNPEFPRHLCNRPARFPRESDRLGFECVSELTSRCAWHADLQFHDSPT